MHLVHHRGGCAGGAIPSALIVTRNYIGQPAGASVQFARCSGPRHSGHMYISVDSSVYSYRQGQLQIRRRTDRGQQLSCRVPGIPQGG